MNTVGREQVSINTPPSLTFSEHAVDDILSGRKTLEARPVRGAWINRVSFARALSLLDSSGAGEPTMFATALVTDITVRPFDSCTAGDLARLGSRWRNDSVDDFVAACVESYARELREGRPVAWIGFEILP